jgi:hypothetical protein
MGCVQHNFRSNTVDFRADTVESRETTVDFRADTVNLREITEAHNIMQLFNHHTVFTRKNGNAYGSGALCG